MYCNGLMRLSLQQERQWRLSEEDNILDLQQRREAERRKIREEKASLARRAAIQVGLNSSTAASGH